uniref:Uncharacterized protein n=1 Tax=Rhizophora mucronata TaxID=61149 RepID=A0A2P2K6K6_RHIMU
MGNWKFYWNFSHEQHKQSKNSTKTTQKPTVKSTTEMVELTTNCSALSFNHISTQITQPTLNQGVVSVG